MEPFEKVTYTKYLEMSFSSRWFWIHAAYQNVPETKSFIPYV